jgi:hypothetical protein
MFETTLLEFLAANVVVDFVTDTVDCDKERAVVEVTLLDVVVCVLLTVLEVLS